MPTQRLSPAYGLSPIRLAAGQGDDVLAWPGLLLHSPTLTWAFDPQARHLPDPDTVQLLARALGLHCITDPFEGDVPAADQPWTFRLPDDYRLARITGPGMVVDIERSPNITGDWWAMAVAHGGLCRLLVAACVRFPPDPAGAAAVLNEAATDRRMCGATIGVEF